MTRQQQILCIAALLLAAGPKLAAAGTVVETTTQTFNFFNGTPATFSFADLQNADELVSISNGSAFGEGGGFTIEVDYSNSTHSVIAQGSFSPGGSGTDFDSLSDLSFPEGTIDGLTFSAGGSPGSGYIPAGTEFTFDVVAQPSPAPEPSTWAMMIAGVGLVGAALKRSRRRLAIRRA